MRACCKRHFDVIVMTLKWKIRDSPFEDRGEILAPFKNWIFLFIRLSFPNGLSYHARKPLILKLFQKGLRSLFGL